MLLAVGACVIIACDPPGSARQALSRNADEPFGRREGRRKPGSGQIKKL
jgi:hypothetical protein